MAMLSMVCCMVRQSEMVVVDLCPGCWQGNIVSEVPLVVMLGTSCVDYPLIVVNGR